MSYIVPIVEAYHAFPGHRTARSALFPLFLHFYFLSPSLAAHSLRYDTSYWLDHLRHLLLMTRTIHSISALRSYRVHYKTYLTFSCAMQASHRGSRPGFIVAPSHFVL
ncbi:hypothetical protein PENSPDRAFT_133485 [Peniophora sp. CONT]|nr:hypothetical protein PENSPDRAFT_308053 [Peniophora sp. CONT]KZV65390.1 hypothetical protein PENSPDRAFT_133485 [Peniophora sp. CONT]